MPDQAPLIVHTVGLCKTFADFWRRPRVEAVKDLNLEIRRGEVFGLLGPNGSGKTTTIKMLLGLLYPTRGRITVFGRPPTDVAVKSRIGFLPEESYLYRFLVAHETLDFYGQLFRLPSRIRRDRAERLLEMVGLRHEAKRRVGEYSKGMARRIGLAQALINDPEFLILDEPTSGLDPIGARQIKDVIRALGRKGKTILLSSHILADVEDVCDRVCILYGGQQRAAGDVAELLRQTDATQITAPSLSPATVEQIRELIARLERKDAAVSHPRLRLEDFFLRIVEEAQVANVRTFGARSGGAMPDFLKGPADTDARTVVDSLVRAAAHPPQPQADASVRQPTRGPAKEVIESLLHETVEPHEAAESGDDTGSDADRPARAWTDGLPSDAPQPASPRPPAGADEGVIEELIGRAERDRNS